jgi:sec-independent protein translocase protein TatC
MRSPDEPLPLSSHIGELRRRALLSAAAILISSVVALPLAPQIFRLLARPLIAAMPPGSALIALGPFDAWIACFRIALLMGIVLSSPIVCWQAFAFFSPAVGAGARRAAAIGGIASGALFASGATFCYAWILPVSFSWARGLAEGMGVALMPDLDSYISLCVSLMAAFGVAFQLPFAIVAMTALGIATPAALSRARPWVILGAFVAGAILTPPDVVSQLALAIPLILLYEIGILAGRAIAASRRRRMDESSAGQ